VSEKRHCLLSSTETLDSHSLSPIDPPIHRSFAQPQLFLTITDKTADGTSTFSNGADGLVANAFSFADVRGTPLMQLALSPLPAIPNQAQIALPPTGGHSLGRKEIPKSMEGRHSGISRRQALFSVETKPTSDGKVAEEGKEAMSAVTVSCGGDNAMYVVAVAEGGESGWVAKNEPGRVLLIGDVLELDGFKRRDRKRFPAGPELRFQVVASAATTAAPAMSIQKGGGEQAESVPGVHATRHNKKYGRLPQTEHALLESRKELAFLFQWLRKGLSGWKPEVTAEQAMAVEESAMDSHVDPMVCTLLPPTPPPPLRLALCSPVPSSLPLSSLPPSVPSVATQSFFFLCLSSSSAKLSSSPPLAHTRIATFPMPLPKALAC
jgi:hypothetical protein